METFDIRTCRERQDAAIEDLQISAGYAQAADARLTRAVEDLARRVAELEAENKRLRAEHVIAIAGTVNWDSGAVAWTTEPPFVHSPGYEANEMDAADLPY